MALTEEISFLVAISLLYLAIAACAASHALSCANVRSGVRALLRISLLYVLWAIAIRISCSLLVAGIAALMASRCKTVM